MTNQTEMTVLDELAQAVARHPGNRADFAKAIGIGQVYLSQILSGKRPLSRLPGATLLKFSKVSGIPMERLADGAKFETPPLAPSGAAE
jgi:transcriptional regulator with XRE-family HTH domain